MRELLGTWGAPPDDVAKVAVGLAWFAALLVVMGRGRSFLGAGKFALPPRSFLWFASFTAALLSVVYIAVYLRGGPRIIDAATYFLQGRALSHGDLAWPVDEPSASFRGRFLLSAEHGDEARMGGIFPPGYPLLLAAAFRLGAPMVVGPALAAALVIATWRLARTVAGDALAPEAKGLVEPVARTAALLSVTCAALRYHTADTMAHAATALSVTVALDAALTRRPWLAGLAIGAVVATRPVSAVAPFLVAAFLLRREETARGLGRLAIGTLPGVTFLLFAQHAVTGAWFASSQKMYYALSDGLPGCFRWGFGRGTGCLYEHGDFVEARLAKGYGLVEALGTTLRRLRMHLLDVANFEPLALLVFVPLARISGAATRRRAVTATVVLAALHVLAYAGFYFDGNYPGGGARLFADVLPLEHVLLAIALARIAGARHYVRAGFALLAVVLAGFAVHGVFDHIKLADRDGGRPMFEPDVLVRSKISQGLVFVDTDHGFGLGHDPAARVKKGIVVARLRNDARDRILYDRLDHPPTYLYKFEVPAPSPGSPPRAVPVVLAWTPPSAVGPARFEAEAEWPVLAQAGGFAVPVFCDPCASGSRALALTPSPLEGDATATIAVPVVQSGRYVVTIRVVHGARVPHTRSRGTTDPTGRITFGDEHWEWQDGGGATCADLPAREVTLTAPRATLVLEAQGGTVALDQVSLKLAR